MSDQAPIQEALRLLPQLERLLHLPRLVALAANGSREEVVDILRALLAEARAAALAGRLSGMEVASRFEEAPLAGRVEEELARRSLSAYRRVINATGVILHTGLGRAVLPPAGVRAAAEALLGYSVVEMDLETGERNHREGALIGLLGRITGAESATVVNNNAAATLLILAALARGKEVIVSRGQLVEIGGSFRIPDILRESGCRLVEVGTTNRTYIRDYEAAITSETGLLLKVHTSNYELQGFVHHTPLEELVAVGRRRGIPVVSDLGSGCLIDLSPHGFRREPLVSESIRAGADLVCFSGDKLLGGPQAGVILGTRAAIEKVRAHPIFRAVRVDKVTLILLESALRAYLTPANLGPSLPSIGRILEPAAEVERRAHQLLEALREAAPGAPCARAWHGAVVSTEAQAGSGALPAQVIPSSAVAIAVDEVPADRLARALRLGAPPVIGRIQDDRVLLDLRTVHPGEERMLADAALAAIQKAGS